MLKSLIKIVIYNCKIFAIKIYIFAGWMIMKNKKTGWENRMSIFKLDLYTIPRWNISEKV